MFEYNLPPQKIAFQPAKPRDMCRLLVLKRNEERITDEKFINVHKHIPPDSVLVLNDSKVLKSRIYMRKETGGMVRALIVKTLSPTTALCLLDGGRLKANRKLLYHGGEALIELKGTDGLYRVEFKKEIRYIMQNMGVMPLPPYIKRRETKKDESWYQNIYASNEGSIASATAGLHFTRRVIESIKKMNVKIVYLTLHISTDTFKPIKSFDLSAHKLYGEYFEISEETADAITKAKKNGQKIIACGTSVVRTLESWAERKRRSGITDILIQKGHSFRVVDSMITNFHQPHSLPLLMVCAFSGIDLIRKAYDHALERGYRFLSYGDAMLIK